MKFAISSVNTFSDKTLPVIVPSLLQSIDAKEIVIFEGGHRERSIEDYDGITYIKVAHNSFDYTALIDIVENELESDYWFLLHDTCVSGPNFGRLVKNIPENQPDVICMLGSNPGTMNICSYKYEYLLKNKDFILSLKNTDYEDLDSAKRRATEAENTLQEGCSIYPAGQPSIHRDRVPSIYAENGVRRNERYFGNLDLFKYQANYGSSVFVLDL
jgi:hypothetical protein